MTPKANSPSRILYIYGRCINSTFLNKELHLNRTDKRGKFEGDTKLPDAVGLWPGSGILLPVLPTLRTVERSLQQTPIKGRDRAVYPEDGRVPSLDLIK
jgi:hypothetical protein